MTEAPTLDGYVTTDGVNVTVLCDHCRKLHYHGHCCTGSERCRPGLRCVCPLGTGDGHRVAHCHDRNSPFDDTGYVIREVGYISDPDPVTGRRVRLTRASAIRNCVR